MNLIKNLLRYVPTLIIPPILGIIYVPIYTHWFSPGDYGDLALARVSINLISQCFAWLGAGLVKFYGDLNREKSAASAVSTVLISGLILALFVLFLGIFFAIVSCQSDSGYYIYTLILFFTTFNYTVSLDILWSRQESTKHSFFYGISLIATFLGGLIFAGIIDRSINSVLLGNALGYFFSWLFLFVHEKLYTFYAFSHFNFQILRKFFKYGYPLVIGGLADWIVRLSDRFVIKYFLDSAAVGLYTPVYNIVWSVLNIVVSAFLLSENPYFLSLGNQNIAKKTLFLRQSMSLFLFVMIPCISVTIFQGERIVGLFVDKSYFDGLAIIPYVVLSVLMAGVIRSFQLPIIDAGKTKQIMTINIVLAIVNLGFNIILLPLIGFKGAAIATLIAYCSGLILSVIYCRQIIVWRFPFNRLLLSTFASILIFGPLTLVSEQLNLIWFVGSHIIGFVVYLLLFLGLNMIKLSDFNFVSSKN